MIGFSLPEADQPEEKCEKHRYNHDINQRRKSDSRISSCRLKPFPGDRCKKDQADPVKSHDEDWVVLTHRFFAQNGINRPREDPKKTRVFPIQIFFEIPSTHSGLKTTSVTTKTVIKAAINPLINIERFFPEHLKLKGRQDSFPPHDYYVHGRSVLEAG